MFRGKRYGMILVGAALALLLVGCSDDDVGTDAGTGDVGVDSTAPPGDGPAGDGQPADQQGAPLMANESPCKHPFPEAWHPIPGGEYPNETEPGWLVAARLTPPRYPFQVTTIRYHLDGTKPKCDTFVAHRVEVFVGTEAAPEASPTLKETINVPGGSGKTGARTLEHTLATPIELQQGEHLYVAVELAEDSDRYICVQCCVGNGTEDRNYISGAKAAPYDWRTLQSLAGIHDPTMRDPNLRIEALGN